MTRGGLFKKFSKYGEGILAVVNLCFKSSRSNNTSKANFSTNRRRSYRSTTEDFIAGNMSMISTQGKAISSTFKLKTRRSGNNWKSSLEKLLWKNPNFKSKQQEQNSTSWPQIFTIWLLRRPFLECTTLLIHN